jgi:glycosidase
VKSPKRYRTILSVVCCSVILALLAGCAKQPAATPTPQPTATVAPSPTPTEVPQTTGPWWTHTVFYQIFVRSFQDSDGDGIGDFQGVIDRLDYLNDGDPQTTDDLGITAIWLMPINPSPSYHGYDVTDYYDVNSDYGTLDDFKRLLEAAHARGISVIMDFVMNHSSTQHPWFIEAQDPASPYHDWYVWSAEDPGFRGPDGQQVWHKAGNGLYYYALFWDQMPDLNYRTPAVGEEFEKIAQFWLTDVGVDGFRIDGAKHLIEEGEKQASTDATHAFFKDFYQFYKSVDPEAMAVGEVWSNSFEVVRYVKSDELDLVFNFDLARSILERINAADGAGLANTIGFETKLFPPGEMATFLTNHDQNRVMTVLMGDTAKAKLAATLLFTIPGVPFLYYGEEIGMTGQGDHMNIRTPMQWSPESGAGFTTGSAWNYIKPGYDQKNVETLAATPSSLLNHYKNLIHLRQGSVALMQGELVMLTSGDSSVLAFMRVAKNENLLVVFNLADSDQADYSLSLASSALRGSYRLETLLGEAQAADLTFSEQGGFEDYQPLPSLPPSSGMIFRLVP